MSNLVSSLLILASIGLFLVYVNPTYRKDTGSSNWKEQSVKELLTTRVRYREALDKTREIETARTGLLEKYNGISQDNRDKLQKLLPDHVDSVRLILDVNNIAAQYGMALKNIALTGSEGASAEATAPVSALAENERAIGPTGALYKPVEFKFSVSGSYDTLRSFLRDLEKSLRLIDVRSLSFSAAGDNGYDYTAVISTYRLK